MPVFVPIPDPGGALGPPRRFPPTALATDAPDPEPEPERVAMNTEPHQASRRMARSVRAAQLVPSLPIPGSEHWNRFERAAIPVIDKLFGSYAHGPTPH